MHLRFTSSHLNICSWILVWFRTQKHIQWCMNSFLPCCTGEWDTSVLTMHAILWHSVTPQPNRRTQAVKRKAQWVMVCSSLGLGLNWSTAPQIYWVFKFQNVGITSIIWQTTERFQTYPTFIFLSRCHCHPFLQLEWQDWIVSIL